MVELFLLLTVLPFGVGLFYFAWHIHQESLDRAIARNIKQYRFMPDDNGNYPALVDPTGNYYIRVEPGNTAYPNQYVVLPAPPSQPTSRAKRPEPTITDYRLEVLQAEQKRLEATNRSELGSEPDTVELLRAAYDRGEPKIKSITDICGVTKGGSPDYQYWSNLWNSWG